MSRFLCDTFNRVGLPRHKDNPSNDVDVVVRDSGLTSLEQKLEIKQMIVPASPFTIEENRNRLYFFQGYETQEQPKYVYLLDAYQEYVATIPATINKVKEIIYNRELQMFDVTFEFPHALPNMFSSFSQNFADYDVNNCLIIGPRTIRMDATYFTPDQLVGNEQPPIFIITKPFKHPLDLANHIHRQLNQSYAFVHRTESKEDILQFTFNVNTCQFALTLTPTGAAVTSNCSLIFKQDSFDLEFSMQRLKVYEQSTLLSGVQHKLISFVELNAKHYSNEDEICKEVQFQFNRFYFRDGTLYKLVFDELINIVIPPGLYTVDTFCSTLNSLLSVAKSMIRCNYNIQTERIYIYCPYSFEMNFDVSTHDLVLRLNFSTIHYEGQTTYKSDAFHYYGTGSSNKLPLFYCVSYLSNKNQFILHINSLQLNNKLQKLQLDQIDVESHVLTFIHDTNYCFFVHTYLIIEKCIFFVKAVKNNRLIVQLLDYQFLQHFEEQESYSFQPFLHPYISLFFHSSYRNRLPSMRLGCEEKCYLYNQKVLKSPFSISLSPLQYLFVCIEQISQRETKAENLKQIPKVSGILHYNSKEKQYEGFPNYVFSDFPNVVLHPGNTQIRIQILCPDFSLYPLHNQTFYFLCELNRT